MKLTLKDDLEKARGKKKKALKTDSEVLRTQR